MADRQIYKSHANICHSLANPKRAGNYRYLTNRGIFCEWTGIGLGNQPGEHVTTPCPYAAGGDCHHAAWGFKCVLLLE